MDIALGIDTGGTFTDAVLVEYVSGKVLAQAKAPTTRWDLAIGIRQAMARVLDGAAVPPGDICLVSISTTLATNAIVEGNGSSVCALLIGYAGRLKESVRLTDEMSTDRVEVVRGGHLSDGEQREPLDEAAIRRAVQAHAPHVQAFAVSGYFGTRNPAHELAARRIIREMVPHAVTCGHELTHRLDALRRAATVSLNARLIPLLCELLDAVRRTMAERAIRAPLMVVRGDGSLMSADMATERPVETILSGPASSVVGAHYLAGRDEMVVADMGGTTTDIAMLHDGRPRLDSRGARVGRWRTMVEAIDVHTVGIGGDSRVWLDEGRDLCIGPRRVIPIAWLATQYPGMRQSLRGPVSRKAATFPASTWEFLVLQREYPIGEADSPSFAGEMLDLLRQGPCPLSRVHQVMRHPELYTGYLANLEAGGWIVRAGFTPTDAAHVLGDFTAWDSDTARLAAERVAAFARCDVDTLCVRVTEQTADRVAAEIAAKALDEDGWDGHNGAPPTDLTSAAFSPPEGRTLDVRLVLRPGIVGVGAPASLYFPRVAHRLHSELTIPENSGVANAVGAVVGSVVQRVHISVVPQEDGAWYRVHLPCETKDLDDREEALAYAERRGREIALSEAKRAGADGCRMEVERTDRTAPVANGWGDDLYLETVMQVTAVGRPRLRLRS